jgi:hypothetical protein
MHCLQSNSSSRTMSWSLIYFPLNSFSYYAFQDQPEEDTGHFVYHCLNRDNANAASLSTAKFRYLC